jgi:HSP20 family molecular chaperone IbpA
MSQVASKNLLLSQPKAGQIDFIPVTTLPHTTVTGESSTEIRVEIPGVDPSTVGVEFEGLTLLVACEKGTLTLPLAPGTDVSKVSADILWGLLTITVPLPAPPAAGSIKVSIHDAVKKAPAKAHSKFTEED